MNYLKLLLLCCGILLLFAFKQIRVDKLQLDLEAKTLHQNKSITARSTVFYKTASAQMVTHTTYPARQVTFTNKFGEFKHYDFTTNSVSLQQGFELSSENSIFYTFLSGQTNDVGLGKAGFKLKSTKTENKMIITRWNNPSQPDKGEVEVVHENNLPIYICFYDKKQKPLHKAYYSNFQYIGSIKIPFTITELEFISDLDSIITRKKYSNLKTNNDVSDEYFNFKIPANAKINEQNPGK
jgi:hypothetical protein